MSKRNKTLFFPLAILSFVAVGLIIFLIVSVYDYFYGMKHVKSDETAPAVIENEYNVVYKGAYYGKALDIDGVIYINMDVINEDWALNMLFYADDLDSILYTTETEKDSWEVGGDVFKLIDGVFYMRLAEIQEMFGTQLKINSDENIIMIRNPEGTVAEVMKSGVYLLTEPNSEDLYYTEKLKRGETLEVYDCDTEGFYYAVDLYGHMGYLDASAVETDDGTLSRKEPLHLDMSDSKLNANHVSLVFKQFYSKDYDYDAGDLADLEDFSYYLNVVCPTYFKLQKNGSVKSIANAKYVEDARYEGCQVWGLFDNQFDDELTLECLKNSYTRERICESLLKLCQEYNLHGINVDFEAISAETEYYYCQFLRELGMTIRPEGYLLSVDIPVPSEWSDFYQRSAYSDICDYVIVMAYDEHYDGSDAGSTSSYKFSYNAVKDSLAAGIDKDKLLLGLPWYTRVWQTDDYGNLSSYAASMDEVEYLIAYYGLDQRYDEETHQNYAEGYIDGVFTRIWIEDMTSLEWRFGIMDEFDIEGIAAWSFGFENYGTYLAYQKRFY